MNILVTGSNGQLGNEIRVLSNNYPAHQFFFTDVKELDITKKDAVEDFVFINKINCVLNCAAYTAVDKAEEDAASCYKINRDAVKNLATAAAKRNLRIVHISTDYVFDGSNNVPYTEEMPVKPAGVYGKSKLEGETVLMSINPNSVIIRTSWLYSSFGNNFVKTMIKLGRERDELNVIFDQAGTPTYAADLADAMLKIVLNPNFQQGVYHYSNEGVCSWYDFTKEIHKLAEVQCKVNPIETKDYPTKAVRPHYSVLNKAKIKKTYDIEIPYWKDSLEKCIELLKYQKPELILPDR